MSRPAAVSGTFYPGSRAECQKALTECIAALPPAESPPGAVIGGLVPHAGWAYSGATAALTIQAASEPAPRCFLLFGAVHQPGVWRASITPDPYWESPLGDVPVDVELADRLLADSGDLLVSDAGPHCGEHSIEVQVPFVRHLCPGATILPVAVPADGSAIRLGERVGEILSEIDDRVVVLGSTDLTHYGPRFYGFTPAGSGVGAHRWSKEENDRAFLDRVLALDAPGALTAATDRRSACGGGAAAATVAAVTALGARSAELLAHTTSHEVRPDPAGPRDFVGYASIIFFA